MGVTTWTAEAENIVRAHFSKETATQIAGRLARIGMPFSRSSIIGKASRMGLYVPFTGQRRQSGEKTARPKGKTGWNGSFGNPVSDKPTAPVVIELPQTAPENALRLSWGRLVEGVCKYPLGDIDVIFCGAPQSLFGGSYCDHHAAICNRIWPPGLPPTTPRPPMACKAYDGPSIVPFSEPPVTMLVR